MDQGNPPRLLAENIVVLKIRARQFAIVQCRRDQNTITTGLVKRLQVVDRANTATGNQFQIRMPRADVATQFDDPRPFVDADRGNVQYDHAFEPNLCRNRRDLQYRMALPGLRLCHGKTLFEIQTKYGLACANPGEYLREVARART